MRARAALLALAVVAVPMATAGGLPAPDEAPEDPDEPPVRTGERVFALTMERNHFNARTWPDTPLLEAYAGETMRFAVHVPAGAEMHTFHLHGHPWEDPDTGRFIDAVMLDPTETHRFTQTAGLEDGHAGDWFYHCHVTGHFEEGMWGLLRVYPYAVHVDGPLDGLEVQLDEQGTPLEGATFDAILREEAGDPSPAEASQGRPVPVAAEPLGEGAYRVAPTLPAGATGELVLTAHHEAGESVARLALDGEGGYTLNRHVGLGDEAPGAVPTPAVPSTPSG